MRQNSACLLFRSRCETMPPMRVSPRLAFLALIGCVASCVPEQTQQTRMPPEPIPVEQTRSPAYSSTAAVAPIAAPASTVTTASDFAGPCLRGDGERCYETG